MVSYKCNLCSDRGIIIKDDYAVVCPCTKQKAILNKYKSAQVSQKMLSYNFESFDLDYYSQNHIDQIKRVSFRQLAQSALDGAKRFVEQAIKGRGADGLLFSGPVGSGKTFLVASIANSLMEHGKEVLFVVVPDLLDEIRATYDSTKGSEDIKEQELVDGARKVEILILDDLGAHNYTEWTRNKIYSIINYRINNNLPTIITTNLDLEELEDYVGERTTSRIIQMCKLYRLIVDTDIRIIKRQELEMQSWKERS